MRALLLFSLLVGILTKSICQELLPLLDTSHTYEFEGVIQELYSEDSLNSLDADLDKFMRNNLDKFTFKYNVQIEESIASVRYQFNLINVSTPNSGLLFNETNAKIRAKTKIGLKDSFDITLNKKSGEINGRMFDTSLLVFPDISRDLVSNRVDELNKSILAFIPGNNLPAKIKDTLQNAKQDIYFDDITVSKFSKNTKNLEIKFLRTNKKMQFSRQGKTDLYPVTTGHLNWSSPSSMFITITGSDPRLNKYQILFSPFEGSEQIYINSLSEIDDTLFIDYPQFYNFWCYQPETKQKLNRRIYLTPDSNIELFIKGDKIQISSLFNPENKLLNNFYHLYRENRTYDERQYFHEKKNIYSDADFFEFLKKSYLEQTIYLKDHSDGLNATFVNYLYSHVIYSIGDNILSLWSNIENDRKHNIEVDLELLSDVESWIDSFPIYNDDAKLNAHYHDFLVNYFQIKIREVPKNSNLTWAIPGYLHYPYMTNRIKPATAFYFAQDYFVDYPRQVILTDMAIKIMKDFRLNDQVIKEIYTYAQNEIIERSFLDQISREFQIRSNFFKGNSLPKMKFYDENGKVVILQDEKPIWLEHVSQQSLTLFGTINYHIFEKENLEVIFLIDTWSDKMRKRAEELKHKFGKETKVYSFFIEPKMLNEGGTANRYDFFPMLLTPQKKIIRCGYKSEQGYIDLINQEIKNQSQLRYIIMMKLIKVGLGLLIAFLCGMLYFKLRHKYQERENRRKLENLSLRIKALQGQLNPHFLFNILSSIRTLVSKNENIKAEHYIESFSSFMRSILKVNVMTRIPLQEEIKLAQNYLELEKLRYDFEYYFQVDQGIDLNNSEVPPLILQPYLENALKHGIGNHSGGMIKVAILDKKECLEIIIEDNGSIIADNLEASTLKSNGLGLKLNKERLSLIYDEQASVDVTYQKDDQNNHAGAIVKLLIPVE